MATFVMLSMSTKGDSISNLESQASQNQSEYESVQESISGMNQEKDNLKSYIENLNSKILDINNQLESINTCISEKDSEIASNEAKAADMDKKVQEQYDSLKARIKFMYELGDVSFIDMLTSSDNISEIMNRTEYYKELMKYDRNMMQKYKDTKASASEAKAKLEVEKNELIALKDSLTVKYKELDSLLANAASDINSFNEGIEQAEALALEYESRAEAASDSAENLRLEAAIRASEEASRAEEESKNKDNGIKTEETTYTAGEYYTVSIDYEIQDDDLKKLATIIYCEAGNQTYEGKLAVGSVVMNRVANPIFPNNVTAVLSQPYQFSPFGSGRFALYYAQGVPDSCWDAAREVLYDGLRVGNWHFFRVNDGSRQGVVIGAHVFY